MRIKTTLSVATLVLGIWSCFPSDGRASDPALENMRSTVGNSKSDLENYRKLLVEFEKAKLKANDQAGATAAKLEIIKLDRELADMDGGRRPSRSEAAVDNGAAEKAAAAKAAAEKAAAAKAAADKIAAEKAAAEKAAAAKAAADKIAAEKATAEKAAAAKAAADKIAAEKAAAEKAAAAKAAADKIAAEKAAAEKAAAAKAAADKIAAERAAAEKAAADKIAAERAAAEKAAAAKAAADKIAAERAAAEKAAAAKAAADKIAAEYAAAERAAAAKAAADKIAAEYAAAEKAAAAKAAAEKIAAERAAAEKAATDEARASAPAPQPLAPILRGPKTQVSSVQGMAGSHDSSKDNVYAFDLSEIGPTTTLTYYATGRRSQDTNGNIWLIAPNGLREKVATWKNGQFELYSAEASYTKLTPVTIDISGLVKRPGTYQIEFQWVDGIAPLVIHRVELTS